ncbi:ATP synthase F1 subunit delta [Bdellovibrio svalbardensis]|uniref:ATP synthase subunit delta n=1 Tax=Bdellovibrio svalbardensis TaxID=2972972 RepID=A0ABT6DDM8_9BACT|nr:ATP synthase F1 subunit delta [Bdellovibrio svalbardensis]MDG0814945.1 ATP synthase F1 subunit delta [Bdellovibrio svalbardensis]
MKVNEVSKRYAKALLAVAKQKGMHAKAFAELQTVADSFNKDAAISAYFENPMISSTEKVTAITNAFQGKGLSEEVFNTLMLMAKKNRIQFLPEVALAFQGFLDIEEGVTRGTVRSAQPLSAEAQKELESKVSKILNKKIVLTYQQDPKLLGGAVAQVGGWTFDDSIETHLTKLNEELNRRAN